MNKLPPTPERDIQSNIMGYLDISGVFWWRQNNGMATYQDKNRGTRRVRYGTEGASDIGCAIGGRYVAIEVKTEKEHEYVMKHYQRIKSGNCKTKRDWHLFNQIGFIENVKDHGGIGFFASSIGCIEYCLHANGVTFRGKGLIT